MSNFASISNICIHDIKKINKLAMEEWIENMERAKGQRAKGKLHMWVGECSKEW